MGFACCCCNHEHITPADSYLFTTVSDEPVFEGAREIPYPLVSCTNCSHVMVYPIPSEDKIRQYYRGADYWQNHGMTHEFAEQNWLQNLTYNASLWENFNQASIQLHLILNHIDLLEDARILDLGSGYAPFLYHCRQKGFKNLYALEPMEEICRYLESQGVTTYPTLVETFITRNDLPQFDLIVISTTLQHLIRPDVILHGLRQLLSEKGVMYIEVPHQLHLNPYSRGLFLHFFNEKSIAQLLTKCRYQTIMIQLNRLNLMETRLERALYFVHGKTFFKEQRTVRSIIESPLVKYLHRFCWRPLKRLMSLKINIFLPSENIFALVRRQTRGTI